MAKKKTTKKTNTKTKVKVPSFVLSRQQKILLGSFLFLLGVALLFSFISYLFTWKTDQNIIRDLGDRDTQTANWLNKFGAGISHFFIYKGFGVPAFTLAILSILSGVYYFFDYSRKKLISYWFWGLLLMVWFAVFFGFFNTGEGILSGTVGFEINDFLKDYLGLIGAGLLMAFLAIVYAVLRFKATPEKLLGFFKKTKDELAEEFQEDLSTQENTVENPTTTSDDNPSHEALNEEEQAEKSAFELNVENLQPLLVFLKRKKLKPQN